MTQLKNTVYVGIDIAKTFHQICALDTSGNIVTKFRISAKKSGFERLVREFQKYQQIIFGMEKTGVYSENLDTYLSKQDDRGKFKKSNTQIILTHSFAVSRLRDVYSASMKTDPFDAYIIAEGLRMDVLRDCRKDKTFSQLQTLLERRDNLITRQTSIISQLRKQLVMCFPDLEQEFDRVNTNTVLAILEICPTAAKFAATPVNQIREQISKRNGRIGHDRLNRLHQRNSQTVASRSDTTTEFLVQNLATELKSIKSMLKSVEKAISEFSKQFETQIELLRSVPGFGPWMPKYFLSVIGNYQRFMKNDGSGAKHVVSYLGLDLHEHSSGKNQFTGSITKQGNAKLRGKLYMAAINAIRVDPDIKAKYEALKNRNGNKLKSLVPIMRLLARRAFGVLKSGIPYNSNIPRLAGGPSGKEGQSPLEVIPT